MISCNHMSPDPASPEMEEEQPFVHEECGDSMWEPVLAQPQRLAAPLPAVPLPPRPLENAESSDAAATAP